MMARSTTRSNQRPDTLMQDRSPPARQNPLATHGRTIHLGHSRPMHSALIPANVRCYSNSDLTLAQLNCPLSANNRLVRAGYNYVETSYLDMQYGCSASGWQSPGRQASAHSAVLCPRFVHSFRQVA